MPRGRKGYQGKKEVMPKGLGGMSRKNQNAAMEKARTAGRVSKPEKAAKPPRAVRRKTVRTRRK